MIPSRRLLEREAIRDIPGRFTLLGQGKMAPSSGLQPDVRIFVIHGQTRQALDIPLWEKGQDDCVTDDSSPIKTWNAL